MCMCKYVCVYMCHDNRKGTVEKKEEIFREERTQEVKAEKRPTWGGRWASKQESVEEEDEYKV